MMIASVENNTSDWVSLDVTHCNFSMRSARNEMRRVVGSSTPDVIIGSDNDQNRVSWKKDKDHVEFLSELYQAEAARGRYFVHDLTSEVNPRMKCVMKIMAMPGARTTEGDLCMLGLAGWDEGGPGFVNASVRTVTNARQVGMRTHSMLVLMQTTQESGTDRNMGASGCPSNRRAMERG